MSDKQAWRQQPISIEQWKANCQASSHVREDDILTFSEREGVVSCGIKGTCVFLGCYFTEGRSVHYGTQILPGTGWNHA